MLRGNERKSIFDDREDKQQFLKDIMVKQKETGFSVYAYCLMDNHAHLLLNINSNDLSNIMKGIGVRYAFYYNNKHKRVGHVFQDRFRSEPVHDDRYLLAVMRYIHNNPVHAGIVTRAGDYPWSSFSNYVGSNNTNELVNTQFLLEIFSSNRESAIKEFILFSNLTDDAQYLDLSNEIEVRTIEEGQNYLKHYMLEKWPEKAFEDMPIDNIKMIIRDLRSDTQLSVRTIAQLLGVNRNIVERIRVK
jgi:Transposase and inactivated derivatives